MRKIVLMMSVSLDGYIEGPDRDISWHRVDEELHRHMNDVVRGLGGLLSGRVTHELMAGFWPTFDSGPEVAKVGDYYNRMEHGQLPASGVAAKVTDALATILDTGAGRLRAAGARTDAAPGGPQAAFARTATPDAEFAEEPLLDADADEIAPAPAARDEIDALFLDG